MDDGAGVWQWIVGGCATALFGILCIYQRFISGSIRDLREKTGDRFHDVHKRSSEHHTSIAVLETMAKAQGETLERIEGKLDVALRK